MLPILFLEQGDGGKEIMLKRFRRMPAPKEMLHALIELFLMLIIWACRTDLGHYVIVALYKNVCETHVSTFAIDCQFSDTPKEQSRSRQLSSLKVNLTCIKSNQSIDSGSLTRFIMKVFIPSHQTASTSCDWLHMSTSHMSFSHWVTAYKLLHFVEVIEYSQG